jgi:CIC family chloride channel protein
MKLIKYFYQLVVTYLRSKLNRAQFIMLIASLVGLVSGLIAVLLKVMVYNLHIFIEDKLYFNLSYLVLPIMGLLISATIIQVFFKGAIERGIAMVLKSIAQKSSFIPLSHTYLHVITSSITAGFGGSVGLEAPIVATGSAIGSNISRISDLNYQERTLLIACGAAAGISAVFNAPIAGVIFAIEVLLSETVISYFIPLIISSVLGVLCSKIILQESSLFNFVLKQSFDYNNIPFYVLLGLMCGAISLFYAKLYKITESRFAKSKLNFLQKAVGGGLLLALIFFLFPPLFGEGYTSIKQVANGTLNEIADPIGIFKMIDKNIGLIIFGTLVLLLKPIAAGITIGAGGNGGNFAHSLFVGAYLGFVFSKLINSFSFFNIPAGNFSLVGMAGVLSGVMYSPLTAIFLIAEITNGYELFIPLMIVSSISFFIVKSYEPYSMEIKKLALQGQIFTHKKEKNILTSIKLTEIIKNDYECILIDKNLKDLANIIAKSEKNIFAVVNESNQLLGIIELNDIKQQLFENTNLESIAVKTLLKKPRAILKIDDSMHKVMGILDETQSWYLPVVNKEKQFVGFVSKTKLFNKYREILSSQVDLYE